MASVQCLPISYLAQENKSLSLVPAILMRPITKEGFTWAFKIPYTLFLAVSRNRWPPIKLLQIYHNIQFILTTILRLEIFHWKSAMSLRVICMKLLAWQTSYQHHATRCLRRLAQSQRLMIKENRTSRPALARRVPQIVHLEPLSVALCENYVDNLITRKIEEMLPWI